MPHQSLAVLMQGQAFVKELDRVLGIADEAQRGKTLQQFQEWDANVHGAIQVLTDEDRHHVIRNSFFQAGRNMPTLQPELKRCLDQWQ